MADIFYVDSGYWDAGYTRYTADASIAYARPPKTLTPSGNVTTTSTQYKFGSQSIYFDGTGDYITSPAHPDFELPGNYTIEMWIYIPSGGTAGTHTIFDRRLSASAQVAWWFYHSDPGGSSQTLAYLHSNGSNRISGIGITKNTWHHIAISRNGTRLSFYLDGVEQTFYTTNVKEPGTQFRIGADWNGGTGFQGYLDEFRIVKGYYAYTGSTYTVPTAAFTDADTLGPSSGVYPVLLLHGEGSNIIDGTGISGVTSTTAMLASTTKNKNASATLSSNFQVTAIGGKTQKVTKTLTSLFTVSKATGGVTRRVTKTLTSLFTLSDVTKRTRTGSATLNSLFTVSDVTKRTRRASTSLTSTVLLTKATPTRVRKGQATGIASAFSVSRTTRRIRTVTKTLNSLFTISDVTRRIRTVTKTITSAFSTAVVSTVGHARYATATLASAFSLSNHPNKIFGAKATAITARATISASAKRTRKGQSTAISSAFSLADHPNRIRTVTKTVSAACTVTKATPTRIFRLSKTLNSAFTLRATNIRVLRGTVLVFSAGSVRAKANAIYRMGGGGTAIPGTTAGSIPGLVSNSSQMTVLSEGSQLYYNGGRRPVLANDVFAIWAKKDAITDSNGTLFSVGSTTYRSTEYGQTFAHLSVKILSDKVKLTLQTGFNQNSPGSNGTYYQYLNLPSNAQTSEAFVFDCNWHHYMLEVGGWDVDVYGNTSTPNFYLWQDGKQFSFSSSWYQEGYGTEFRAPSQYTLLWTSEKYFIGADAPNPTNQTYYDSDGYRGPYVAPATDGWNGTLAQFWYGNINLATYPQTNVPKLYNNGYVNVTTSGAPTPFAYALFDNAVTESGTTYYTRFGDAEQHTASAGSFVGYGGSNTPKNLQAYFSVFPGLSRIKTGKSTSITSRVTIRAVTGPVKQFRATLSSRFTVRAQGYARILAKATGLTARATITRALANPIKKTTKTLNAVFTVRAHNTVAVFGAAHITTAKFTVKVKTSATAKNLRSQASLYVHPMRVQRATVVLPVRASVHANGGLFFNGHFGITAVCILRAKLTVVPKVDDLLTVPVDAESRCLRTLEELRLSTLQTQSRVNRTLYEDRCLVVTDESRTVREAVAPVLETTSLRIRRTVT